MGFVKKTLTCLACRAPIAKVPAGGSQYLRSKKPRGDLLNMLSTDTAVCKNCKAKGRTPEMYQKHVSAERLVSSSK